MSRVLLSAILVLALVGPGDRVFGQTVPPDQPVSVDAEAGEREVTPEAPAEPETSPISGLVANLQDAISRIHGFRTRTTTARATKDVAHALPDLAGTTERMLETHRELDLETIPLHRLDLMRQQWGRLDDTLKQWQAGLDLRSRELGEVDRTLRDMREHWHARAQLAEESRVPEELLQQVRSLLLSIEEVAEQVGERQSEVLKLLGRVTELRTGVTQASGEVEYFRGVVRKRILTPDSPPLWDLILHPGERISLAQQVQDTVEQDTEQYRIFMKTYGHRVPLHLLLLLLLSITMPVLWFRIRKRDKTDDDPALRTARLVFSRPFSAAAILTAASTRLFYPLAPVVVYETIILLAVFPILRLVPRMVVSGLRPAIYGLAGLFVLQQAHVMTADETLLQRLVLLLTSSIGLGGAVWIVRPRGRASTYDGGRWWKAAIVAIRFAVALFAIALLGNLVGSVELAELLTEATLYSAFGAVGLAVSAVILEALLTMLIRSRAARATGMISRHADLITRRLTSSIRVFVLLAWIVGTLNLFRLLEGSAQLVARALSKTWTMGNLTISLGSVLAFVLAIVLSVYVSRLVRFILNEDVFPRLPLQRGVPSTLSMLINYAILTLGFLSAMAIAGIQVSQFAIVFGALGVGIGFGLQNVVNNFISGLILVFERPIKIGDTIEVGTMIGEVRRIGIRSSTVRTYDGAEVIVPNGNLISAEVINWTLSDRVRRIRIPVGVAYGTDPEKVLEILVEVARKSPDILSYPEPYALFTGFGASSLDFELRVWTANFDFWMRIGSQVTVAINRALQEAGITIPFPQRDLHLRSVDASVGRAFSSTTAPQPGTDDP